MLNIQEIKKITQALSVSGDVSTTIKGISINSRTVKAGYVFIAVKGDRFDGHDFIRMAIRNGAVVVIVSKRMACLKDAAVIRVKDTTRALGQIAAWHRRQFNIPVIAITGSTGKTTTKDMAASVLSQKFKVLKNEGTENNHFGVPLTLLKLKSSHQVAILELGTNQPGDIRWLAEIVRPTVVIFTNIGESHLERLKTKGGVFREKAQLIKWMDLRGSIIYNGDDSYLEGLKKKRNRQKMISFGRGNKNVYRASCISLKNNQKIQFKVNGRPFAINTPAEHNIYNALAAISCGLASKISYNNIAIALSRFKFRGGRQEIKRVGRLWLINDTYNANPVSFKSAIDTLNALKIRGKKIIVCADMLELGSRSKVLHQAIGVDLARSAVDAVVTVGGQARYMTQALKRSGSNIKSQHCRDLKEVQQQLNKVCQPGDAILIKGSRGMHMEKVVVHLEKRFK